MTTLSWVPRINITKTLSVTPTITASSAYASGNQLGGIMTLPDAIRQDSNSKYGNSLLVSVTILDSDKQDSKFDIYFFNQSPTITSSDKTAFAITAANLKAQAIGAVSVGATYSDAAAVSQSVGDQNINLPLQVAGTAAAPTNLYAVAVCRGTPTYTTTSSITFLFSFYMD